MLIQQWLAKRPVRSHKGMFGRVLVVAGSCTMCGAGYLCAKSALAAGAGQVYWALPQSMQPSFAAALPEAITLPMPQTDTGELAAGVWDYFPDICQRYHPSVLVVGPGMGNSPLLPLLLQNVALPLVVDADALNALAQQPGWHIRWPATRPSIFTPHPGEMARLLHQEVAIEDCTRQAQAQTLAELTGGVSVLKGSHTQVCARLTQGWQHFENNTGGPALAKAGAGDVLAGLIAGLWAQLGTADGFSVDSGFKAAACGVYLHGLAGDLAARAQGLYSVLAQDIIAQIGAAFMHLEQTV